MFTRVNAGGAHQVRPPHGRTRLCRLLLPRLQSLKHLDRDATQMRGRHRDQCLLESRAMSIVPIVSLVLVSAVYPALAFAVIYFAVRLAIRHELHKRAVS